MRLGMKGPLLLLKAKMARASTTRASAPNINSIKRETVKAETRTVVQAIPHQTASPNAVQREDKPGVVAKTTVVIGVLLVIGMSIVQAMTGRVAVSPKQTKEPEPITPSTAIDRGPKKSNSSIQLNYGNSGVHSQLNDRELYLDALRDMAGIQDNLIRLTKNVSNYPKVTLGEPETSHCTKIASPGLYNPACKEIVIIFDNGSIIYETPIEVLYVLAHEYGHHLTNITFGNSLSRLDNELTADCFAGLMTGHWIGQEQLTKADLQRGFMVMAAVAKQEATDASDPHGDPGQRMGAFAAGIKAYGGEKGVEFANFCKTLEKVLKI